MEDDLTIIQMVGSLNVGGAESVAAGFAEILAKRGWNSHVVCTRTAGPLADRADPRVKIWCARRSWKFDVGGMRRIVGYLRENRPAIVHSHSHTTGYIVNLIRRFTNLGFLHVFHDHHGRALKSLKCSILDPIFLRGVDAYLAVTRELRERAAKLLSIDADRCLFVRNGVKVRDRPHRPGGGKTVVQVGNLVPAKGHETALLAADCLRRRLPGLRWWCVGAVREDFPEHVGQVMKLKDELCLEGCVEFLGTRSDVGELLEKADVGVLTSDVEAMPLSLLEYMAEGLPVVVTSVGECGSIVEAAGCGFVADTGDHEAIARCLHTLLTDTKLATRIGEAGRRYVLEHYGIESVVDEVERMYRTLLKEKTSRRRE